MIENQSNTGSGDVYDLCVVLAPVLQKGNYDRALALATLALVHADHSRYVEFAHAMVGIPHGAEKIVKALEENFSLGNSISAEDLYNAVEPAPLALLLWLDALLSFGYEGMVGYPESVYRGDVLTVDIDDTDRNELHLPSAFNSVFLCQRLKEASQAPIQSQLPDPARYAQNWHVIPDTPNLAQAARKIAVYRPDSVFQAACKTLRAREGIRIYLAEFKTTPEFDSRIHAGANCKIWSAKALRNVDKLVVEARGHLERAATLRADVVVFPELTVPPPILNTASDWLSAQPACNDESAHVIQWVVAGSFHVTTLETSPPYNVACVLDRVGNKVVFNGKFGLDVWSQAKLTSVDLNSTPLPHIVEGNERGKTLKLLHTPLGLQGLAICLDLAQFGAMDSVPLEHIPLRWLWVPSLSNSVHAHQERAKVLCLQRRITIVCANQAQANFGEGHTLGGKMCQSFVWENVNRSSAAVSELADGDSWRFVVAAQDSVK